MALVRFSPEAVADLNAIFDYLAGLAGSSIAAAHVEALHGYCASLDLFPERGVKRDDIRPGLRLVGFRRQATIAFAVTDEEVRILRVFGKGRDVVRALSAPEA